MFSKSRSLFKEYERIIKKRHLDDDIANETLYFFTVVYIFFTHDFSSTQVIQIKSVDVESKISHSISIKIFRFNK